MLKKILLSGILLTATLLVIAQSESEKKYKLVVHFASFAEGVPSAEPLTKYIQTFKAENNIECMCVDKIGPLGREGEYNLAFELKELNKRQTRTFIDAVTKLAATMNERGQATVTLDETIDLSSLSSRATVTREVY